MTIILYCKFDSTNCGHSVNLISKIFFSENKACYNIEPRWARILFSLENTTAKCISGKKKGCLLDRGVIRGNFFSKSRWVFAEIELKKKGYGWQETLALGGRSSASIGGGPRKDGVPTPFFIYTYISAYPFRFIP